MSRVVVVWCSGGSYISIYMYIIWFMGLYGNTAEMYCIIY